MLQIEINGLLGPTKKKQAACAPVVGFVGARQGVCGKS